MPGTIRVFLGLLLMFLAASVDDSLPDFQFFLWAFGLAIPGALLGFWGVRAMNRSVA